MNQSLGPVVDSLGISADLEEHESLTDVLIIGRITKFDGDASEQTRLLVCHNPGLDWISQMGLIAAASQAVNFGIGPASEEE